MRVWMVVLVLGCGGPASLDLRVDLKTDYVGGVEVRNARLTLLDSDNQTLATSDTELDAEDLTQGIRIGEVSDLRRGTYRVQVELQGQLTVPVRTVTLNLDDSYGVTVVVARGCLDVSCPDGGDPSLTECLAGRCVSPECTPETPEACPDAECNSDGDCSSTASCAAAACVGGFCTARPNSESCFVAQYCNPEAGCTTQPCSANDDCGRCARCGGTECEPYTVQSIHAGHQSTCLLDETGERWCWGNDPNAELGMGESAQYRSFPRSAGDGTWADMLIGWERGAGLRTDGTRWGWGGSREVPEQTGEGVWTSASLVNDFTVVLQADGTLWESGEQLGTDTDWVFARAGWNHGCAIKDTGALYCWGENEFGQLGFDSMGAEVAEPTQVGTDLDWVTAGGGVENSCGVKTDGTLWCWGTDYGATPTQLGADTDWVELIYKWHHGCGLKMDGTLLCMGGNSDGELGRGPEGEASAMPEPITMPGPWSRLTVGGHFACAFNETAAEWYCWGAGFGLGAGTSSDDSSSTPVALCPPSAPVSG